MLLDLEMHEILRVLYPNLIPDDEDESFDASVDAYEQTIWINESEMTLGEFVNDLLLLTPIQTTALSGAVHAFVHPTAPLMLAKRSVE